MSIFQPVQLLKDVFKLHIKPLLRRCRLTLARMTNLSDNLDDVFTRLWLQASPIVRKQTTIKKQKYDPEVTINYGDDKLLQTFLVPKD